MSRLLIAAPLRLEAWAIASGRPPARVQRTGMGPRRAHTAVPALLEDPAEALLVLGFGGGLASDSRVGEVIVADAVREPECEPIRCHRAEQLAAAIERAGLPVQIGSIVSVKRIAVGETRTALGRAGALAVDMESAWLGRAARGRPFSVVRVLSDTPSQELLRPRGAIGVARACAVLRRVAAALHEWTPEQ
jgi:4-hydroxy-3-methylbut-2-enyl diphosphate reductase